MNLMKQRKKNLLAEAPVQLVLALFAWVFLAWPIIQIAADGGAAVLFVYVFVVWFGLILLLWRIGRAIAGRPPRSVGAAEPPAGAGGKP